MYVQISTCVCVCDEVCSFWNHILMTILGNGFISLESVQARGHYIGVNDDGSCKTHLSGGISDDEKFFVLPVQPVSDYNFCEVFCIK